MGITAMSLNRITYLFKEGLRGVCSHGFRSFASVTVIAACLIIMGSFGLVAVNVDNLIGNMEEDSQILAFVDESLSDSDALSIEGAIRSIPNVRDVVSVFMMSNTIKLATFTRRDEIAVMKMVGASNSFIRTPFVVEGLILGLLGSGIAFLLQWAVYNFIAQKISVSIAASLIQVMPFSLLMTPLLIVFLAIGILVGAFGGAMAIRNYLKV